MPGTATQWTTKYGGSSPGFTGPGANSLRTGNWIANFGLGGDDGAGLVMMQVHIETTIRRPAYNYASRPCGADATVIDQTTINCATLPAGTLRFPDAPVTCAGSTTPRHDYITHEWQFSSGSPRATPGIVDYTGTPHTFSLVSGWPTVLSVSFPGSISKDERYPGMIWQGWVQQHMNDPLWQRPHIPCVAGADEAVAWLEDDGSGQGDTPGVVRYFAMRPWVEARFTVPAGSPALPAGVTLNDDFSATPPGPPPDPTKLTIPTPWGIWNRQNADVLASGRFAAEYLANGATLL
jgi:hypothetical protein